MKICEVISIQNFKNEIVFTKYNFHLYKNKMRSLLLINKNGTLNISVSKCEISF